MRSRESIESSGTKDKFGLYSPEEANKTIIGLLLDIRDNTKPINPIYMANLPAVCFWCGRSHVSGGYCPGPIAT
jgi:hypothetical protein